MSELERDEWNPYAAFQRIKSKFNSVAPIQTTFWFTGDTTETTFSPEIGWKPVNVFENGLLVKEGSGDEYTITVDAIGGHSVVFNSAPAAVDIAVIVEKVG